MGCARGYIPDASGAKTEAQGNHTRMTDPKPATTWALASLVLSILGCIAHLTLLALLEPYGEMANRSAGVGIIWMALHGLIASALSFFGILAGVIALIRIRFGGCRGQGKALTGIAVGLLPLAVGVVFLLSGDANPFR